MLDIIARNFHTFLKAQTTALISTVLDFAVSIFLHEVCQMWYVIAVFFGAFSGGILNCCLNYRWAFSSTDVRKRSIAWRYVIVWIGSLVLNTGGTALMNECIIGSKWLASKTIVSVLVAIFWNYNMQKRFVFKV